VLIGLDQKTSGSPFLRSKRNPNALDARKAEYFGIFRLPETPTMPIKKPHRPKQAISGNGQSEYR